MKTLDIDRIDIKKNYFILCFNISLPHTNKGSAETRDRQHSERLRAVKYRAGARARRMDAHEDRGAGGAGEQARSHPRPRDGPADREHGVAARHAGAKLQGARGVALPA